MRIISGTHKGKKLLPSTHLKLRPTTDKNRESLFNILTSGKLGLDIEGSDILDICCGTGSVSLEFLSRGANSAFLIDNNPAHITLAQKNADLLGFAPQCQFLTCDVKKLLRKAPKIFDLIFIDPPYAEDYKVILTNLLTKNWLAEGSLIVVECDSKNDLENVTLEDVELLDVRRYGKTSFAFLKVQHETNPGNAKA